MSESRRDPLRPVAMLLALVGIGIAGYLTYVHYAGIDPVCTGGGGCEKVQTSEYAELVGVPVALLGLLGYIGILSVLALWREETGRIVALIVAWGGLAFSGYLQYRSLVTVDAKCIWCIGSAITMLLITLTVTARFVTAPPG